MRFSRFLFFSYLVTIFALFLYSFTQVDLSLTLSRSSIYQTVEKQLQYLGFFQRPQSALVFSLISILLFSFYLFFLSFAKKEKLTLKNTKVLIFLTFIILVFSYNAFSYDLFNYIFDAKILTFYHLNPYLYKPLDFTNDPMLNFMRWTHRVYPYGPSWLMLTAPLSFLGFNYFLPTFFMFKLMIGLSFVGSSYLIYKISEIVSPKNKIFNTVFWSFNPLLIIEGLVSSHNDFPLVFFALLSIYLLLIKKNVYSLLSLIFSIGVKYSTAILIPMWAAVYYYDKTKKKINYDELFILSVLFSLSAIIFASFRTTFQPWYLILSLSLASFISRKYYILIPALLSSFFAVSIYVVYVYMTDYSVNYPQIISNIEWIGLFTVILTTLALFAKNRFSTKH